ncbi:hypothetical protein BZA70DRAFT_277748 [Myxozyma melibiosi]|uniref:Zn(2)-C6 fungal-type domain-containing protein n=1 Tax=Myxozyma melibiosi TaxID=54550 RepID=A0ABR1F607_9ASCO
MDDGLSTTGSSPAPKRTRVSMACTQCRARKARCDRGQPACSSCLASNQQCSYDIENSKKRGLPTGHAHEMELRTSLFERILGIACARDPSLERELLAILRNAETESALDDLWPATLESSELSGFFKDWYSTSVSSEFEHVVDMIKTKYGANAGRRRTQFLQQRNSASPEMTPAPRPPRPRKPQPPQQPQRQSLSTDVSHNTELSSLSVLAAAASTSADPSTQSVASDSPVLLLPPPPPPPPPSPSPAPSSYSNISLPSSSTSEVNGQSLILDRLGEFFNHFDGSTNYVGPSSGLIGSTLRELAFPAFEYPSIFPFSRRIEVMIPQSTEAGAKLADEVLHKPLPSDISHLLSLYFVTMHSWLPILDRFGVIKLAHQGSSQTTNETRMRDVADRGILWAVLALSTAHLDGGCKVRDTSSTSTLSRCDLYADYALTSLSAAQALISESSDPFAPLACAVLQSLLSLLYLSKGLWADSWHFISSACRYALDTGSFLDSLPASSEAYATSEARAEFRRRRLRAWAGFCVIDTIVASRTGMMPNIRAKDWPLPAVEETGADEWDVYQPPEFPNAEGHIHANPARCLSVFNQYMALVRIWNTVLTSRLYHPMRESGSANGSSTAALLAKKVEYFVEELKTWESGLPSHCFLQAQTRSSTTDFKSSRSNPTPYLVNMNMTYLLVQALVYSAVFNHPGMKTSSTPESMHLMTTTMRSYSRVLLGMSQLLRLVHTTPILYMHLLPSTFEYFVFRTTSLSTFLNQTMRNSLVSSAYGDYKTVLSQVLAFLKLVMPVWPAAILSLRVLSNLREAKKAVSLPISAMTPSTGVPTPTASSVSVATLSPEDPPTKRESDTKEVLQRNSMTSEPLVSDSGNILEDLGDLSMFGMKASGEDVRLEQFMQNLGYVNGLDIDFLMAADDLQQSIHGSNVKTQESADTSS